MGIVADLMRPAVQAQSPLDDFWYQSIGSSTPTTAGTKVEARSALGLPAFWAAVNLRAKVLGSLPLHVYRRRGEDREIATDHPWYEALHSQANGLQTSMQFRQWKEMCRILRGNSYAYIWREPGQRPMLLPLHPDCVEPQLIEVGRARNGLPEYSMRYRVTISPGRSITLLRDEVHHTIGFSLNGIIGVSVVEMARQTLGTALAVQEHSGAFFGNGARPGGLLVPKQNLSTEALDRLKAAWNTTFQGARNANKVAALPIDVSYTQLGLTNEDSQMLETQEHLVRECARLLEVPPHLVGETTKDTSWGTGIEQMSIGFVVYHVSPWLEGDEQALKRDLLSDEDDVYAEHSVEGLLRGDSKSRAEYFQTLRQNGVIDAATWARKENLPIPEGEAARQFWRPANMVDANAPSDPPTAASQPSSQTAHHALLIEDTAARVVRREVAALGRIAKTAASPEAWQSAVAEFYLEHRSYVASALHVPTSAAIAYCDAASELVSAHGMAQLEQWETQPGPRIQVVAAIISGGFA